MSSLEKRDYTACRPTFGRSRGAVSGRSLGQFFREEIFSPLGMNDTFFHVPDSKMKRFASSYGPELELVESAEESPYRQPERHQSGGGGLVSTAEDYLRFCTMLLNNGALGEHRILQPETVASMTQNHLPSGVYAHGIDGFGLGVKVRLQDRGHQAHQGQYGWNGVASTHFFVSPKDKIVFIALSQRQPFSDQLRRTLTPLVYQALAD